jgi:hypothetical protein
VGLLDRGIDLEMEGWDAVKSFIAWQKNGPLIAFIQARDRGTAIAAAYDSLGPIFTFIQM